MNAVYCQSCGMPMNEEKIFGTEKDEGRSREYCVYCYEKGEFKQPNMTVEDMIDLCVPFMKEDGKSEEEARTILTNFLPTLKRWSGNSKMNEPVIIEKEAFTIIGMTSRTSNANEMTMDAKIPQMWEKYYQQKIYEQIPNPEGAITYGLYSDYLDGVNGEYSMTIGLQGSADASLPEGLVAITIPAAKYVVFTTEKGPIAQIVIKAWQQIWAWFEQSDFTRAYTGDFEVYDERCANPLEAQVDIYIAIKQ
ncbi:effector binding domain-containing protein [Cytobacillus solani]|uniref:Transcriptional regulator n=1 Tax=Cytobacillus solani TaxID=1637975 RepID=A0A0Q3QUM7_9BACI|nr:effector binding domain-containing protein [Cytobacillus solani]KOP71860.1 transcriptional regulator [Bacillus sp. FJAT-21945]KQL21462.1 transcriptional regulator [Cytobacillus solani]